MCVSLTIQYIQIMLSSQQRFVSFDVGIKNLAYCVLDLDVAAKTWRIVSWNCVNLLTLGERPVDVPSCQHAVPGKRKSEAPHDCGKRALWRTPDAAVQPSRHYCKKHAETHTDFSFPNKDTTVPALNKLKVDRVKELHAQVFPTSLLSLKKSEMIDQLAKHYTSVSYVSMTEKKKKSMSAGDTDLVTIGRKIKQCLDADPFIAADAGALHVLIENQISTIASRMKTIQGMIAQYFIMRFDAQVAVDFVSSSNKLKGLQRESNETGYKANKQDGIHICRTMFESNADIMNAEWKSQFEQSNKRDDLADCFLQVLAYLAKHNQISYADNLKINIV